MSMGKGGAYGANPFQNASQGLSRAFTGASGATSAASMLPALGGYEAYLRPNATAIHKGIPNYTNPYEDAVIDRTVGDIDRIRQLSLNDNAGAASGAGAFGGARHGIVDALTNSEAMKQIGDFSSRLRHQGFTTGADYAARDVNNQLGVEGSNQAALNEAARYNSDAEIGTFNDYLTQVMQGSQLLGDLAGSSYQIGTDINARNLAMGNMQQALKQAILDSSSGMFDEYASQPEDILALRLQSLGANPLVNATSTTTRESSGAGFGSVLGGLLQAGANMFSFAPISLSSSHLKHDIHATGEYAVTTDNIRVPIVKFKYKPEIDPDQNEYIGVLAESIADSEACWHYNNVPIAVDYSKVRKI